jgi:hypothetical protein
VARQTLHPTIYCKVFPKEWMKNEIYLGAPIAFAFNRQMNNEVPNIVTN